MMRHAPTAIAALFLALTLARVASFVHEIMGASWPNAVLFSAGMAAAVYASAYYSRAAQSTATARKGKRPKRPWLRWNVRTFARVALVVFLLSDGAFNLADALRTLYETGQTAYLPFGIAYGIFPTAAAGLLGLMQGYVDRLPHKRTPGIDAAQVVQDLREWLRNRTQAPAPIAQAEQPSGYACGWDCGRHFDSLQARAGHMKACANKNGHEPEHVKEIAKNGSNR